MLHLPIGNCVEKHVDKGLPSGLIMEKQGCASFLDEGVVIQRQGIASAEPIHERKVPSKNSVRFSELDNRSVILFVTVCTANRIPVLANAEAFNCIVTAFRNANLWHIGRFLVMPDHIHFFCAPGRWPPQGFHRWMSFLKSSIARTFPMSLCGDVNESKGPFHLFQTQCWDTQIRSSDDYAQKLEYVRNNPVRKGLVSNAAAWPYQGAIYPLIWRD